MGGVGGEGRFGKDGDVELEMKVVVWEVREGYLR
jgi:hypothetical protein